MHSRAIAWVGGLVLFALPVSAQDLTGSYDLRGQTNRRGTQADITITQTTNGFTVTRTARFTGRSHRDKPAFTWTSDDVIRHGNRAWVIYRLNASGGISGALTGGSGATQYRFLGRYRLENGVLKEFLYNYTRTDDHSFWRTARLEGRRASALAVKARGRANSLGDFVMEWATDVADYYAPGDEDVYRRDSRAARRFFHNASWIDAPVPAGVTAAKAIKAAGADPADVIGGDVFVLFDANDRVTGYAYVVEGTTYDDDLDEVHTPPSPPAPNPNPTPPTCVNPVNLATILQRANAERSSMVDWIMDFRTDIADYYGPGDQSYYNADVQSAQTYFSTAQLVETTAPTGYSAYKTIKFVNSDPDDIVLGTIYLLFDCNGKLQNIVYDHEGEIYDDNDI